MTAEPQTHEFQAQTQQILDIVIHSLYSNKEIFLRELISNASDALDRLRFEGLTDPSLMDGKEVLEIRLDPDPDARTLTVSDNGIGMSRDEVVANIGTIARSGTREVAEQLREGASAESLAELIGQFGVGFYSAFMVADKVTLVTRRAGEESATRWESSGGGEYTLSEGHRFMRGTTITLHLKPVDPENGIEDFTDPSVLRRIVKRHSDFVAYPIVMKEERREPVTDGEGGPVEGETRTRVEEVTLNSMRPIWTRSPSEVGEEEYKEFYRHISHDWGDPLEVLHLRAEGRVEYQTVLFLPSRPPFDLYYRDVRYGLQLYVRRVLIMDRCEELLPPFLRFVRGAVDSPDLPLNISREMVQQDRHIRQMRRWLARKVLDHLGTMQRDDRDKYLGLWRSFGPVLKEGIAGEPEHHERLVPLLLFHSTRKEDELTTLSEYVERMPEEQEEIYYLTGESRSRLASSPHLEAFRARGYEVLLLTDPVDELVVQALEEHQEKRLRSVEKGALDLGSEEERQAEEAKLEERRKSYGRLLGGLQKELEPWVKEVRISRRLTDSPACLVGGEHDMSPRLERLLRRTGGGAELEPQKRILELNPDHPILEGLRSRYEEGGGAAVAELAHLLYGYALLAEGSELPEPARFNRLLAELMAKGLGQSGEATRTEAGSDEAPSPESGSGASEEE